MVAEVQEKQTYVKPLHDYVLFEEVTPDETPGGLKLPEGTSMEDIPKVRVLATGPGYYTDTGELLPMPVQEGDVAYMAFAYNQPHLFKVKGRKLGMARARDFIALVSE